LPRRRSLWHWRGLFAAPVHPDRRVKPCAHATLASGYVVTFQEVLKLGLVVCRNAIDVSGDLDTGCPGLATLFAPSLPSLAGGVASVASGLPLGFQGGFPRCLLGECRLAGRVLGFQRGLTSGSLGELLSG
jgi:hypothetical protein